MFELLQIKSDMWHSSSSEDAKNHSEDSSSWSQTDNDNIDPLLVKRESDDEKEEGEIKDDDEDTLDDNKDSCSGSPNPVNLSLNTKHADDNKDNDYENKNEVR